MIPWLIFSSHLFTCLKILSLLTKMIIQLLETFLKRKEKEKKSWYKNSPSRQTRKAIPKLIRKLNWPLIDLNRNILFSCLGFWWTIISLSSTQGFCKCRDDQDSAREYSVMKKWDRLPGEPRSTEEGGASTEQGSLSPPGRTSRKNYTGLNQRRHVRSTVCRLEGATHRQHRHRTTRQPEKKGHGTRGGKNRHHPSLCLPPTPTHADCSPAPRPSIPGSPGFMYQYATVPTLDQWCTCR